MTKIFVDTRVMVKEGDTPSEITEQAKCILIEKGADPSKLENMGTGSSYESVLLTSIFEETDKAFQDCGYSIDQPYTRKTSDNFMTMQNNVYDIKKEGSIFVASKDIFGALILGATPLNDELVGMVKTEIMTDDQQLVDKIRQAYEHFSLSYVEKDVE